VFSLQLFAVEPLNRVTHCRRQFGIGAPKLFEQHISKTRCGISDVNGIYQRLDMVIHDASADCAHDLRGLSYERASQCKDRSGLARLNVCHQPAAQATGTVQTYTRAQLELFLDRAAHRDKHHENVMFVARTSAQSTMRVIGLLPAC